MLDREQYKEYISENYYIKEQYSEWIKRAVHAIRNHSVIIQKSVLLGAVFILISAVDLVSWIQLPLLALVFGALVYMQLDYKDSKQPQTHRRILVGNKYVMHIKSVKEQSAYTGETQRLMKEDM